MQAQARYVYRCRISELNANRCFLCSPFYVKGVLPNPPGRLRFLLLAMREICNLLPNNRRQRRTCYALCHILYPVSADHTSIFRMDSNSTSYSAGTLRRVERAEDNVRSVWAEVGTESQL